MEKYLFLSVALLMSIFSFAQSDTSKIEQYCEMTAEARMLSKKVVIDIDFGEARKLFGKDTRLKDDEGKLKKFNGVVDAINYLGQQGWKLFNAYPVSGSSSLVYHYIFRKEFNKSDIEQ